MLGKRGPFPVIEDQGSGDVRAPMEAPRRRYSCDHYETCLSLAAALNWDNFTCRGCNGSISENLLWRAHQVKKRDSVAQRICDIPAIHCHDDDQDNEGHEDRGANGSSVLSFANVTQLTTTPVTTTPVTTTLVIASQAIDRDPSKNNSIVGGDHTRSSSDHGDFILSATDSLEVSKRSLEEENLSLVNIQNLALETTPLESALDSCSSTPVSSALDSEGLVASVDENPSFESMNTCSATRPHQDIETEVCKEKGESGGIVYHLSHHRK